ncbi:DHA2 family efflux MFS transporter permease subunit [Elizabethkingia anophelis]|uniref:DHA2 family efflux MFS transporter permease subunit n=1 Tax=Elizabethkingia anophelis TaxID=1117645 RepID=UPI0021A27E56|nr:DHA2 family efflux MFS transporter permease subunit [Elizabethkingia anophelis]MCT3975494.1 DHA2 family efflux MFS transporter permease subunit [Elizabethkingia anophelis]MCT4039514.1 DHA2 family efflux MFS transporter permease subunit [Elizabethkingia anophelis]MCT4172817.1 DHA2 family efflux MFS transporter permease subunit [Elizabethkingia anophelis]MCT4176368.1 DHA2 family efflux MFS transporter permease subunit [Elizabethkingia anophelis]
MNAQNKDLNNTYKFLPWIAALAIFMQSLDGTILNTALPSIAQDMNRSPLTMQSIIISYVLILALLIPLSGWLSDRFGSKKIFIWAVGIFTVGSLLCALSTNLGFLILSRIIQAIGGSMMVPVSRLAILYTYSKDKLLGVINFITIPGLVGPIIGPTLGGWLVDVASWHWNFLINIPIGIAGILFARKYMPDYVNKGKKFDLTGMLLFSGSLLLLTIAIELGSEKVINGWWLILVFAAGILLMNLYYRHFKKVDNPLIDLNLIKIRTLRIGVFGNLLTRLGIGGMPLLLPLLFQVGFKHTAIISGMMLIPSAITTIMVKPWVVPIVKKLGYKKTLIINTILIAVIISLFAVPNQNTPLPLLIPLLVIYGAVNSIQLATMNTLSLSDLDNKNASNGNSLLMVMQQLSMSLGISVGAYLLNKYGDLPWVDHTNSITVFRYTFLTMGVLTALASLIFFRLKSSDGDSLTGAKH